jgi:hypothetical protein
MSAGESYVGALGEGLGNSPLEKNATHVDSQSVVKRIMTRTQIQLPNPSCQRLKEIAERQDWSLSAVTSRTLHSLDSRNAKMRSSKSSK